VTIRFYDRDNEDRLLSIERCHFDAANGSVPRALSRIADLKEEFPSDSDVLYSEALIRCEYLGQGLFAGKLYQDAFARDPRKALAACNAAIYSTSREERVHWLEIAKRLLPTDQMLTAMEEIDRRASADRVPFWAVIRDEAIHSGEQGHHGNAAARLEIALQANVGDDLNERILRRARAEHLREQDRQTHRLAEGNAERPLACERLALQEALREITEMLRLDEYDPEAWNFKAAWCVMLERYQEANEAADRASALRPNGYAKPHHNRALALQAMGRYEEARTAVRNALHIATDTNDAGDIALAQGLLKAIDEEQSGITLEKLEPMLEDIVHKTMLLSEHEESRGGKEDPRANLEILAQGLLRRGKKLSDGSDLSFVPLMAELLTYVTPDTCFWVLSRVQELSPKTDEQCMHAVLYLVGHATGVVQLDAARLMALFLIVPKKSPLVRKTYRLAILEPLAAAGSPFTEIDQQVRCALAHFHPFLPSLVADQEPVGINGIERARRVLLPRLTGPVPKLRHKQRGFWRKVAEKFRLG
jgi:tetratricopeptide (TPR) repeat protein